MTWNEGKESEMSGQGEINFEKIWQKMDQKEGGKEDVIGICSHRACQKMTEYADLSALGQMKHWLLTVLMNN